MASVRQLIVTVCLLSGPAEVVWGQVDWGVPSSENAHTEPSENSGDGQYMKIAEPSEECVLKPCLGGFEQSSSKITYSDILNLGVLSGPNGKEARLPSQNDASTHRNNATDALPSIDIEILFDLGSARIRADQIGKLASLLAVVKANQALASRGVVVLGHTDSKGPRLLNQRLSEQRADAVSVFLRAGVDVPVFSKGLADTMLKFPSRPFADQNRRVQIVFVGS